MSVLQRKGLASRQGRCSLFFLPILLLLCMVAAGFGCRYYSPTHRSGNPWLLDQPMRQATNTLLFQYVGYTESGMESGIRGEARLLPGSLPEWAAYYTQAKVLVYVTDQGGRVVEKHQQEYAPGTPIGQTLFFDFNLDSPSQLDDRNFYISFGYFLEISEFAPETSHEGRKLIRHEAEYK